MVLIIFQGTRSSVPACPFDDKDLCACLYGSICPYETQGAEKGLEASGEWKYVAKLSDKFIKCFLTPGELLGLDPISGGNRMLRQGEEEEDIRTYHDGFLKGFKLAFRFGYREGRETCGELESGKIK